MSRWWTVAALDLRHNVRRPLYLLWAAFFAFNGFLISRGRWIVQSVDTSIGGDVSWFNSEFEIAYATSLMSIFLLAFLVALGVGLPVVRDERLRLGEILHATPLRVGEYVAGKVFAAVASCGLVVGVYVASLMLFSHGFPDLGRPDVYGPFRLRAYLAPAVVFMVPALAFVAGASFLIGVWTRRALAVFLLPISLFLFFWNWFWGWFPADLDPSWIRWVNALDPSGFRWLKYEWLMVDRGIRFYNIEPIGYDAAFLASRLAWVAFGGACVWVGRQVLDRRIRSTTSARSRRRLAETSRDEATRAGRSPALAPDLGGLAMQVRARGVLANVRTVARFELRELIAHPALYILLPIVFSSVVVAVGQGGGPFATDIIITSGVAATLGFGSLAFWSALILLFYGVEVFRREEDTRLQAIYSATPVSTSAVLFGKLVALGGVVVAILVAGFAGAAVRLLGADGAGQVELGPFALMWGVILLPTLIAWLGWVAWTYHWTRHRYATYGLGIAALVASGWHIGSGEMTWSTNWGFFLLPIWSDIAPFGLDRTAVVLNRLLVLAVGLLLIMLARLVMVRRERDVTVPRSRRWAATSRWLLAGLGLSSAAVVGLALALHTAIAAGVDGGAAEQERKDYWRTHVATFSAADLPEIRHMDLEIELLPDERQVRVAGTYRLRNQHARALPWVPVTRGVFWKDVAWTWDGAPVSPDDLSGLFVFEPPGGLTPGSTAELGFAYTSTVLPGPTRDGAPRAVGEWVLPTSVVLTGRNPDFLPRIGLDPERGVDDEENLAEPARFPPGAHLGATESETDRDVFTARLRITAPDPLRVNSMGVLVDRESLADGRTAWTWETDYPVRVVNLIAGDWQEALGEHGTAVYYDHRHAANVPSMVRALDAAVEHFGAWFAPYPWRELRLSEFANLTPYARGNPTNILFSEGVGFLSKPDDGLDVAFTITAHEAAHQWFGHLVANGDAPGGIVLSEGAAHFATMLLLREELGDAQRQRFMRQLERNYGEFRDTSREKPLVDLRWHRQADGVVIYEKGGWVFWMLMRTMGRDAFLAGLGDYFDRYHEPYELPTEEALFDHPVIEDFLAVMRPHASDVETFDGFVEQWFYGLAVPEYRLTNGSVTTAERGWDARVTITNLGGGAMPVEVAAFGPGDEMLCSADVVAATGQSVPVEMWCAREPTGFVVDPEVHVLQLQRRAGRLRLGS